MLTYQAPHFQQNKRPAEWPWLLLCLVFVWLWPGIIGHDLWQADELHFYAALRSVEAESRWFAPTVFGQYSVQNAPVLLWLAFVFKKIFAHTAVSAYTATRLAVTLLMAIALTAVGGAGRQLLGKYHGRSVVLLLIGSPGIMIFGHMLSQTVLLFTALCVFAYAVSCRKTVAGVYLAIAWLMAFWAGNFPALGLLLLGIF